MRDVIVNEILIPSLIQLYDVDFDNIRFGVSERNICSRLAFHMENLMRGYDKRHSSHFFCDYFADVEYNRMGNGDLKHYESSVHRPVYMVSDLLIQKRGYGRNLLAMEMKRTVNHRNVSEDKERLKALVSSSSDFEEGLKCVHDTLMGVFVVYSPQGVEIELYENIEGRGEKTDERRFNYNSISKHLMVSD